MDARAELDAFLQRHRKLAVLTGAGCSAPSGIPDYRDRDGGWKHGKPMTLGEFTGSVAARRRYWAGSLRGWPRVRDARPNPAHEALARLERQGRVARLVTQNVDGLHQKAGSRSVVDLHGRLDCVDCLDCGGQVPREDIQQLLGAWNPGLAETRSAGIDGEVRPDGDASVAAPLGELRIPDCPQCGGVLKPAVVFFGESVPRERVGEAFAAVAGADALLVIGSSLMVYSGYRFVRAARERGIEVAAVNLGRTRADPDLTLKVEADCAALLAEVVA